MWEGVLESSHPGGQSAWEGVLESSHPGGRSAWEGELESSHPGGESAWEGVGRSLGCRVDHTLVRPEDHCLVAGTRQGSELVRYQSPGRRERGLYQQEEDYFIL